MTTNSKSLTQELRLTLSAQEGIHMHFRLLPAGQFRMGARGVSVDEEPVHTVTIRQPFYLGIYPVTQAQYAVFRPEHRNGFPDNPQHPAEKMSWDEAREFGDWLMSACAADLPEGYRAGLPSEAQWEYACRLMKSASGQPCAVETEYYTGDGAAALRQAGWFSENSEDGTHAVGQKRPTDFGLHDLHGNVDEWVWDDYVEDAYKVRVDGVEEPCTPPRDVPQRDPNANRVVRGGSWYNSARYCRAAIRFRGRPDNRLRFQGFRVCLFPGSVPQQATVAGVTSEPVSVDAARRQAAAESEDAGVDVTEADFSRASFPERSDGTKF